jgi:UDP-N-acetylmuramate dehydrogenase
MFDIEQTYQTLQHHFQDRVRRQELLVSHCSFGVGGPADIWVALNTEQELEMLIRTCTTEQWPLLLVGAGRNIIFADAGVRGVVARIDFDHYTLEKESDETAIVTADAGVRWPDLLRDLLPAGWAGLEFGVGIPGTLGAGVISNAGVHNQALGQALEWVKILDARSCNGGKHDVFVPLVKRRYNAEDLDLGYRHSRFRVNRATHLDAESHFVFADRYLIEPAEIIVQLGLRVHRLDQEQLKQRSRGYFQERQAQEPMVSQTGPIFKEPEAYKLVAEVGLAGKTIGNAQIAPQHANYITNLGGATAADMAALIVEAHRAVLARSGVALLLNVELLGEWPSRRYIAPS